MQMQGEPQRGLMGGVDCSSGAPPIPPHKEGNESAGAGLFLLGFPVWVLLLSPFRRAGSVWRGRENNS